MKKIIKKLILLMGFLFVGSFFIGNNVYAAGNLYPNDKTADSKLGLYQTLGQSLYTVTWSLIVIAGQFMDNHVVYGSFIGMDTLLWKIWNVMRTFANYIIGLILIFSIFTLFLGGKFEQFNPIKIIPQLLISAVLVNASWFLIGACIDVSNVLTYSVGILPMKVAGNKVFTGTIPTFGISLQSGKDALNVGLYEKGKILPFCELKSLTGDGGLRAIPTTGGCVVSEDMKYYLVNKGLTLYSGQTWEKAGASPIVSKNKVSDLIDKFGGMTGILGTLYGSIVNVGRTVNYNSGSTVSMSMDLILKLIFLFALVIPLFTLAVLLIVRTVILWMFIIISPIVFLFTSVKSFDKFLGEKGKLGSLCCMVFMPVIVVFTLSISFIFLSSLNFGNITKEFGISGKGSTISINMNGDSNNKDNKITMTFKGASGDSSLNGLFLQLSDTISWIIRSIFSVGFMWVLVFAALKSCKITGGIASSIQNFSQSVVKATPIVPVAGGQSVSSLGAGLSNLNAWPKGKQQTQFQNGIGAWLEEQQANMSGTGDTKHIEDTDKALQKTFGAGGNTYKYDNTASQTSDSVHKGLDTLKLKKYKDMTVGGLLKDNGNLKDLASKLGVGETTFKTYLTNIKDNNKKLSELSEDDILKVELGKYKDMAVENLLKDENKSKLTAVASSLHVDENILRSRLEGKAGALENNIPSIKQAIALTKLKKTLKDKVIGGSITLLQLNDGDKKLIKDIFKNNGYLKNNGSTGIEISQNKELAKLLQQMGFDDNDIVRLLTKSITGTTVSKEQENKVQDLLK